MIARASRPATTASSSRAGMQPPDNCASGGRAVLVLRVRVRRGGERRPRLHVPTPRPRGRSWTTTFMLARRTTPRTTTTASSWRRAPTSRPRRSSSSRCASAPAACGDGPRLFECSYEHQAAEVLGAELHPQLLAHDRDADVVGDDAGPVCFAARGGLRRPDRGGRRRALPPVLASLARGGHGLRAVRSSPFPGDGGQTTGYVGRSSSRRRTTRAAGRRPRG